LEPKKQIRNCDNILTTKGKTSTWLFLGILLIIGSACKPITEEDSVLSTLFPEPINVTTTSIAQQPEVTTEASSTLTRTPLPPPLPTPEPTSMSDTLMAFEDWKQIGDETSGLGIAVPPKWVNLSGQIDVPTAANQIGLLVLLLADSDKTGNSILAGKELSSGAFVMGMVSTRNLDLDDPLKALDQTLDAIQPHITRIGEPILLENPLVQSPSPANDTFKEIIGVSIDVLGDPIQIFNTTENTLRTRILIFQAQQNGSKSGENQAVFLLSAPADQWDSYKDIFELMVENISIFNIDSGFSIRDGTVNILGNIDEYGIINGKLERGIRDLWSFDSGTASYATITLNPTDKDIDLAMTIIDPSGETASQIDTGFAGDSEVLSDLFLADGGRYIVEVSEFFNESGRYTLNLMLRDEQVFNGKGLIISGQGIQSELSENARHIWTFSGTAGQLVSVILTPLNDRMDAILDLYDPEGKRLVALDEGFSGDAEVIAGYELPVTGEYSIMVRSFAGNGGLYTLSLDEGGEETRNFFDAGDLSNGNVKAGELRVNEAHAWFFEGRVGDVIGVEVVPKNEYLDLEIWLLDPYVERITTKDDFGAGKSETIESINLSQDGQFLILVKDYNGQAGEYEIRFTSELANAPVDAGYLFYGEPVTRILEPGQSVVWRFNGIVDDVIDISLVALNGQEDLLFLLQDPEANTVLEIDTTLAGESEGLTGFTITADGQWRIVVKEFFGEGGSYTLTVNRTPR